MAVQYVANRYQLQRRIMAGDTTLGIPELWEAYDSGDYYFVKLWRRKGADTLDIRALWNREVRGLMRLQGYPGASEVFVRLHEGGLRQQLAHILDARRNTRWLQNLGEVNRRRPLWDGLLRIAEGLTILHREGTLHRALSSQAVFASPDGEGDFRLSGFEWSLRVAGKDGAATRVGQRPGPRAPELGAGREYSTLTDWFDFGVLAAELFGCELKPHKKAISLRGAVERLRVLNVPEQQLIQRFLADDPDERPADDNDALQQIRDVVRGLNAATAGAGRNLIIAARLGPGIRLSEAIERASRGKAPASDIYRQRLFLNEDLAGDVRVVARNGRDPYFVVRGARLEYKLKSWQTGQSATWVVAYCDAASDYPRSYPDDQYYSSGTRKLEILSYPDVRAHFTQIRDRSVNWDRIFPFRTRRVQLPANLRDVHDFFRVTQQLDTILTAAQICPVEVLKTYPGSNETEVLVTPRPDPDRTELAHFLHIDAPEEQLRDWFHLGAEPVSIDDEVEPRRDTYSLLDRRVIANEATPELAWQFLGANQTKAGPVYRFRCEGSPPLREGGTKYLAKNFGGSIAQIRRRYAAIEEMRNHATLLGVLDQPAQSTRHTDEPLAPERISIALDESKQKALAKLWKTQPFFAIQGPPGTGKTTLIQAFADRLLSSDPTAQVLLTAHSHHTVDDVLDKLQKLFSTLEPDQQPVIVRLGARDHDRLTPERVTRAMIDRLRGSELAKRSPNSLVAKLDAAAKAASDLSSNQTDVRTMQALVQDAANLTLATSNSSDLAQLAKRGRRFDWSVIEEAGKAHGFDMATALEESHRLLLIGDHFQLPPFNAQTFKRLLEDPLRVRKAIETGQQFAPSLVDTSIVTDEEEREPFADRCDRWRRMVELFAMLFKASMQADPENAPAATLNDQHRMHPDIAEIVGKIFYPADVEGDPNNTLLRSPEETLERFKNTPPFAILQGSWLPEARIVWCDLPWVQKTRFAAGETQGLFEAKLEARAVADVLGEIRAIDGQACSVQILSPYNDQLGTIRETIEADASRLAHIMKPPFNLRSDKRMGATVDEFQGSEADVVIVSLVRNNGLVPAKSIGFLRERNRMNVLLSRARQKLVIVGSWEFWKTRVNEQTSPDADFAYLGRMMDVLEASKKDGKLARVDAPQ